MKIWRKDKYFLLAYHWFLLGLLCIGATSKFLNADLIKFVLDLNALEISFGSLRTVLINMNMNQI